MAIPILYSGTRNASSWAMRAWLALREADIEFVEQIVDIRRPQRFINLARIAALLTVSNGAGSRDDEDLVIFDSTGDHGIRQRSRLRRTPSAAMPPIGLVLVRYWRGNTVACRISVTAFRFESAFYPHKRPLSHAERTECATVRSSRTLSRFEWRAVSVRKAEPGRPGAGSGGSPSHATRSRSRALAARPILDGRFARTPHRH